MPIKQEKVTARILGLTRLQNSENGNPRYRVRTDKFILPTGRDSMCAFLIENSEYQGVDVEFTIEGDFIVSVDIPK